jgi:imidazolonepropionase-like amidohydrolase
MIMFVKDYRPGRDAYVELRNGRFLDVINGCYFDPEMSVIILGGKIESMPGLPGDRNDITPDFTIDLKGKTVMPGLFNTHCHIQMTMPSLLSGWRDMKLSKEYEEQQIEKNMADCLAYGITNIRDTWTEDLRMNRGLKGRISRGEIPGPRITQSILVSPFGGSFAPKRGLKDRLMFSFAGMSIVDYEEPESGVVAFPPDASVDEVRDAVNRAIDERGAECIKIYDQREKRLSYKPGARLMTPEQLRAVVDQTHRRDLKSTMHHISVESFRRGLEGGVSSLAHVPYDASLTETDMEAFIESDCIIEPTLSFAYDLCWNIDGDQYFNHPQMNRLTEFRNKTFAALVDQYWIPELRNSVMDGLEKANQRHMKGFGFMDMSRIFRFYSGVISYGIENIRMLFQHAACMACANDAGAVPRTEAMMGHELAMLDFFMNREPDEKQFSCADALRVATINSARAMGLEESFGSIETGKTADLVIVDGDPLEDFRVIGSRAAALFMNGRLVINECGFQLESR